ncbi:hypothetical protein [uncultured Deinococcus sp.]|uniref:hypothetical protein n=1 Tax=uncultured Deinococcus sp. TaxID=158789 RepID=UPI0026014395|nr:hypothetical protein [uncultured Deinococcus sp.]
MLTLRTLALALLTITLPTACGVLNSPPPTIKTVYVTAESALLTACTSVTLTDADARHTFPFLNFLAAPVEGSSAEAADAAFHLGLRADGCPRSALEPDETQVDAGFVRGVTLRRPGTSVYQGGMTVPTVYPLTATWTATARSTPLTVSARITFNSETWNAPVVLRLTAAPGGAIHASMTEFPVTSGLDALGLP